MHLPDGFLSNGVAGGFVGASAFALAFAVKFAKRQYLNTKAILKKKLALEGGLAITSGFEFSKKFKEKIRPRILLAAVLGSLVFSLQMINFPIANGTSGHFLGGALLAFILGPFEGLLIMAVILIVQSIFFADGGLIALGANIFNMGVLGSFMSYYLARYIWKRIPKNKKNYFAVVFAVAWFSVLISALFCSLEIYFSGVYGKDVFSSMAFYHCLIGLVEGLITVLFIKYFCDRVRLPFVKDLHEKD